MPFKVNSTIELLKIIQVLVGQPGIIELYITDKNSVLIGNTNNRITISDVIAALSECRSDAEIEYVQYDKHLQAYKIIWS